MHKSVEDAMLSRIYGHGRGWAFSRVDFMPEFDDINIRKALSDLAARGTIRRICRGIYDYPRFSPLLQETLSPDIDQVARALARKFKWTILPSGDTALNLLGLSTQVPAKHSYLSTGPSRQYDAGQTITFTSRKLRDADFSNYETGILVQAIQTIGKDRITEKEINRMKEWLNPALKRRVLNDTRQTTVWIQQIIKQIAGE
jgi:hypothetical protein